MKNVLQLEKNSNTVVELYKKIIIVNNNANENIKEKVIFLFL